MAPVRIGADQGDVAGLVAADHLTVALEPIGPADADLGLLAPHVLVGDDIVVGGDQETAAVAASGQDRDHCASEIARAPGVAPAKVMGSFDWTLRSAAA